MGISSGMCHMGAITTSGKLYLWGCNKYGQLGNPDIKTNSCDPVQESSQRKFSEIACGLTHTLALTKDGYVFAAGDNDEGQCGVGKNEEVIEEFEPVDVLGEHHVTKIIAGCHSAAITEEEHIYVWGTSTFGQFLSPERSVSLTSVVHASIGRSSGACVDREGKVWTWGYNEQAQLGLVDTEPRCIPTLVKPIKKKHVYAVAVGAGHVIAIGENKIQGAPENAAPPVKATEESKYSNDAKHRSASRKYNEHSNEPKIGTLKTNF